MRWSPPKVVGLLVRGAIPGLRRVHAQVAVYAKAWDEANALALAATGPLWVVLGDSTAQGIGAPSPDQGYVGQVHRMLEATTGQAWRVLNLSKSGERVAGLLATQLPRLEALDVAPDLVTCAIGSNDVIRRTPLPQLERDLREIIGRLPPGSVVATMPAGLGRERVVAIDAVIRSAAAAGGCGWPTSAPTPAPRGRASTPRTASTPAPSATPTGPPPSPRPWSSRRSGRGHSP